MTAAPAPAQQLTLLAVKQLIVAMYQQLAAIQTTLGVIMTEDAAVAAEAADILAQETAATAVLQQIQAAFAAVLADEASAGLSPATITTLQQAQAGADAFGQAIAAAGSADAASVPAAAAPPAAPAG